MLKRKITPSQYRKSKKSKKYAYSSRIPGVLSGGRSYLFNRTASFSSGSSYPLDALATNGLNGTGYYDMQLSFSLSAMNALVHGVTQNNWPVPNYAEFTSLFDLYRIKYVVVEIFLNSNSSTVTTPAVSLPIVYTAVTSDDAGATTQTAIQQYSTCKTEQFQTSRTGIKRIFRPKPSNLVYNGITSGYSPTNQWLDTAYPETPHFGMKIVFDPIHNTTASQVCGYVTVVTKYVIEFRNAK